MTYSQKYGRTYHYPFSPGITNDDRINKNYWQDINNIAGLIHTEKLDGENNCLNKHGVFARSHALPTTSAWTRSLRQKWDLLKYDLGDYEIFGENIYAIHSIKYTDIDSHFYVFGVRGNDQWLSWEETMFIASVFDFPTVPVIESLNALPDQAVFERQVRTLAGTESAFRSIDVANNKPCRMEGIVTRNINAYPTSDFEKNVFKYVRSNHVTTDAHWTKNWKRTPLKNEKV